MKGKTVDEETLTRPLHKTFLISKHHPKLSTILESYPESTKKVDHYWYLTSLEAVQSVMDLYRDSETCIIGAKSLTYCFVSKMYERIGELLSRCGDTQPPLCDGIYYKIPRHIVNEIGVET